MRERELPLLNTKGIGASPWQTHLSGQLAIRWFARPPRGSAAEGESCQSRRHGKNGRSKSPWLRLPPLTLVEHDLDLVSKFVEGAGTEAQAVIEAWRRVKLELDQFLATQTEVAASLQKEALLTPDQATFMDWHAMRFSLWAFLVDAGHYLAASERTWEHLEQHNSDANFTERHRELSDERLLAQRHMANSAGEMVKILEGSVQLFPAIRPAYDAAVHIRAEAKRVRDMHEHSDQYHRGKGQHQSDFMRNISGGNMSATAVVGDMVGGLDVPWAIAEARAIYDVAKSIPPPPPRDPHEKIAEQLKARLAEAELGNRRPRSPYKK